MFNFSTIASRVLLLGMVPLCLLLLVLIASFQAANTKDQLFHRLYHEQLASEVATLSDIDQQISLAGNEQQQTAGRFVSGIAAMHQASQQLHQGASQSSQAAEELTALAAELERGWQQFRTN